jgi:hypothetical protein
MENQENVQKESNPEKIEVHATKEGKLYIVASELFSLEKVKVILSKVAESEALRDVAKVEVKE